jgi:hypothetical protein
MTTFKVPATFTGKITDSDGAEYQKDASGNVTIPDDKVHDGLYGWGFSRVVPTISSKSTSSNS